MRILPYSFYRIQIWHERRPNTRTTTEPQREIPVTREVDVIVAGAGMAGIAAAMAAESGVAPGALDVKRLQKALIKQGTHLGKEVRLRELGLI